MFSGGVFKSIVAFSTKDFYPSMAARFINDFTIRVFVNREEVKSAVVNTLNENRRLGQHSDVVLLTSSKWERFIWGSPSSRPFGLRDSSYLQCSCGVLRSQNTKMPSGKVDWRCKVCKQTKSFDILGLLPPSRLGWVFTPRTAVANAPEWFVEGALRIEGLQ